MKRILLIFIVLVSCACIKAQGQVPPNLIPSNSNRIINLNYDFCGGTIGDLTSTVSGTSAANSMSVVTSSASNPCALRHTTGTTATGRAGLIGNTTGILFGGGVWSFSTTLQIANLSDAIETYTYRVGFVDSVSGESVDGVFFRYTNSVNSGNWQGVTRSNNSETVLNSGVAASTSIVTLGIVINANGSLATFFINGVSIGTISTTIPTANGRQTSFGSVIIKSLGITARIIDIDRILVSALLTNNR